MGIVSVRMKMLMRRRMVMKMRVFVRVAMRVDGTVGMTVLVAVVGCVVMVVAAVIMRVAVHRAVMMAVNVAMGVTVVVTQLMGVPGTIGAVAVGRAIGVHMPVRIARVFRRHCLAFNPNFARPASARRTHRHASCAGAAPPAMQHRSNQHP